MAGGEHYDFVRQAQAFASAINEDTEPAVSARDGLESLRVVLALYESASTGEIVRL
jgi:predicted dehydrogenase